MRPGGPQPATIEEALRRLAPCPGCRCAHGCICPPAVRRAREAREAAAYWAPPAAAPPRAPGPPR